MTPPKFILRVLRIIADAEWHDGEIWWHSFGESEQPKFFVNCNDFFYWGTSDCERITRINVGELEAALADCCAIDEIHGDCWAHLLFCARQRRMRPQGAFYKSIPQALWPLFDSTGPERQAQFGNPLNRPADELSA